MNYPCNIYINSVTEKVLPISRELRKTIQQENHEVSTNLFLIHLPTET